MTFRRVVLAIVILVACFAVLCAVPGLASDVRTPLLSLLGAAATFLIGLLTKQPDA